MFGEDINDDLVSSVVTAFSLDLQMIIYSTMEVEMEKVDVRGIIEYTVPAKPGTYAYREGYDEMFIRGDAEFSLICDGDEAQEEFVTASVEVNYVDDKLVVLGAKGVFTGYCAVVAEIAVFGNNGASDEAEADHSDGSLVDGEAFDPSKGTNAKGTGPGPYKKGKAGLYADAYMVKATADRITVLNVFKVTDVHIQIYIFHKPKSTTDLYTRGIVQGTLEIVGGSDTAGLTLGVRFDTAANFVYVEVEMRYNSSVVDVVLAFGSDVLGVCDAIRYFKGSATLKLPDDAIIQGSIHGQNDCRNQTALALELEEGEHDPWLYKMTISLDRFKIAALSITGAQANLTGYKTVGMCNWL